MSTLTILPAARAIQASLGTFALGAMLSCACGNPDVHDSSGAGGSNSTGGNAGAAGTSGAGGGGGTGGTIASGGADARPDAPPAVGFEQYDWSGPQGYLHWLLRRPADEDGTPRPLYVALHGCSQTADGFAAIAHLEQLADSRGAYVALPQQSTSANALGCWNWFAADAQQRDGTEPTMIVGVVQQASSLASVDPKRVHVFGLSAGGAMAVVLASTWPDVFASAGVVAGCPYRGTPCVSSPSSEPAEKLAGYVVDAMGSRARLLPMIVMQGDADQTVPPANAALLVGQWLGAADRIDDGVANASVSPSPASTTSGSVPNGYDYQVAMYEVSGDAFVESWTIRGQGHAWPGGVAGQAWSDPKGPDATVELARFFDAHPMP